MARERVENIRAEVRAEDERQEQIRAARLDEEQRERLAVAERLTEEVRASVTTGSASLDNVIEPYQRAREALADLIAASDARNAALRELETSMRSAGMTDPARPGWPAAYVAPAGLGTSDLTIDGKQHVGIEPTGALLGMVASLLGKQLKLPNPALMSVRDRDRLLRDL